MINKDIKLINEMDLKALVESAVMERKDIDYKQELATDSDGDKKEFLADVSSFANAGGGDLIIGIVEDKTTGEPKEVRGIEIENPDKVIQKLDSIIRDGLSPRIPSAIIWPIKLTNGNHVLVLRISQSWISPHRVVFKGSDKFYSRNSSGKYPLNVEELRSAFTLSESLKNKILNFRADRISKIIAGETPVLCREDPKVILHLIPLVSFNRSQNYDIQKVVDAPYIFRNMQPINHTTHNFRYNFDGFLTYSSGTGGKATSYFQLFRSGIIEAIEAYMLSPYDGKKILQSLTFEKEIIDALSRYLNLLQIMNVAMPIFLYLTLVGVKGYILATNDRDPFPDRVPIDRDILYLPEKIIENYSEKAEHILKSSYDALWNASGYPRDKYYDEEGDWKPPRY
jgi:hypothetical protein